MNVRGIIENAMPQSLKFSRDKWSNSIVLTEATLNICPRCSSTKGTCTRCGKPFAHGTASHCDEAACREANAPIACKCGHEVADNKKGILDWATMPSERKLSKWK
jgi:hypothetical protein